jgi:hypothetical protein
MPYFSVFPAVLPLAMPPNPKTAAMSAMMRQVIARGSNIENTEAQRAQSERERFSRLCALCASVFQKNSSAIFILAIERALR